MLVLPISLIVALVLGFLLLQSLVKGDRPWLFSALLAVCAFQSVITSLTQYYGVSALLVVQPVTATIIPPLAWVAFQSTAVRSFDPRRDLLHLAAPAFTALCVAIAPIALDVVVPTIFLIYGGAILYALRAGPDSLPLMRLEVGNLPRLVWAAIALALILSGVGDGLIAVAQLAGRGWLQAWIVSASTSISLLLIGLLVLSHSVVGDLEPAQAPVTATTAEDAEQDADLMQRLNRLIADDELYLNPGLTLAQLARRLHVPAKQLSAAINRATGENVSRYINGFRVQRACQRLSDGDSVTEAMLASGFNTKSNFNREFLRITGSTPSDWRLKEVA